MLILAIDTSGKTASVALAQDEKILGALCRDSMLDHSRALLPLIMQLLDEHGVGMGDIGVFAATIGPGSFTGVRIGCAAVKGFAFATDRPCAGVSSLASMAYAHDGDGFLCARIFALHDEYYYALFEKRGSAVTRLTDDAVGGIEQIDAAQGTREYTVLEDAQSAVGTARGAYRDAQCGALLRTHELTPSYLRVSQAERLYNERQNRA